PGRARLAGRRPRARHRRRVPGARARRRPRRRREPLPRPRDPARPAARRGRHGARGLAPARPARRQRAVGARPRAHPVRRAAAGRRRRARPARLAARRRARRAHRVAGRPPDRRGAQPHRAAARARPRRRPRQPPGGRPAGRGGPHRRAAPGPRARRVRRRRVLRGPARRHDGRRPAQRPHQQGGPPMTTAPAGLPGAGLPAVWQRVRGGSSLLPIVAALVGIWLVLGAVDPAFLAPENLVNLTLQSAPVGVIALGVVLVLLVGQIDLSVGSLSGVAAAVVAVGSVTLGWPVALAFLAALVCGVVVGIGYGVLSTRLGLPSFVFTLAGLLFLAGVQLRVLGPLGSINLPFESWFVRSVQQGFLPTPVAWGLVAAIVVAYGAVQVTADRKSTRLN